MAAWIKCDERPFKGGGGLGDFAPPPNVPPLSNGRSSHLIEAAKRGRLDQMIFFSAPLTTRVPPIPPGSTTVRPDVWPDVRAAPVSSEEKKKNAGGPGGGSPPANPVKGGSGRAKPPQPKFGGSGGQRPPAKTEKF